MAHIIAWSQEDMIDAARSMQMAAEYAAKDFSLSDIEQISLINQFCRLRDSISLEVR